MDPELEEKINQAEQHLESIDKKSSFSAAGAARSFMLGLFYALGATIGLAIVLALLGFILKEFGALPGVGNWFSRLGSYLQQK